MAQLPKVMNIDIDLYKEVQEHIAVKVQVKRTFRVKLGMFFIKIGCLLSGAQYVEEFPLSLMQDNEPIELERIETLKDWLNKQ